VQLLLDGLLDRLADGLLDQLAERNFVTSYEPQVPGTFLRGRIPPVRSGVVPGLLNTRENAPSSNFNTNGDTTWLPTRQVQSSIVELARRYVPDSAVPVALRAGMPLTSVAVIVFADEPPQPATINPASETIAPAHVCDHCLMKDSPVSSWLALEARATRRQRRPHLISVKSSAVARASPPDIKARLTQASEIAR
jgi:hypothetical protein